MNTDTQQRVLDFLGDPKTHGGARVERIDTHSAVVFLAGPRALKLKRAVRYDYLDFSTEPLRRAACEAEVRINGRAAPSLYRGVLPITEQAAGRLALGGSGAPVDWVVDMARFDQEQLFDRLASRGALDVAIMRPLAAAIARFHEGAVPRRDHGGRDGMRWVVEGNAAGFAEQGRGVLDPARCAALTTSAMAALERLGDVLDARRANGHVRQCHGDLHLRNLVLLDGAPVLFDAIEFNDEISCVDVLYDLAFLLMDLWRRGLRRHANEVWNGYLVETGDHSGLALVPLFLSCRAGVRAKTSATAARLQKDPSRARELERLAGEYLDMAIDLLTPAPAWLLAVGGLSGSGKSTLARGLAPAMASAPGALLVRSDEVRKSLCGVASHERLGQEAYTAAMSERVYQALVQLAAQALAAGHTVIADAVFTRPADRAAVEGVAAAAGVPFRGLWLEAPGDVLATRADAREPDASDADASVVRQQLAQQAGPIAWTRLDASTTPEEVLARAREALGLDL